jgi:TrmH family RNA methyltransferase
VRIEIEITSRRNARVLEARRLKRRVCREEKGQFLLEGIRGIEDALDTGVGIHEVLVSPYLFRNARGCALYERLVAAGAELHGVTEEVLEYVADTDTPQGVVAIVGIPDSKLRLDKSPLVLAVDGVRDPGNLGTLIRSADAFGLAGLILSGDTVDPFNPKCVRATMGSVLRVPIKRFGRVTDSIEFLKPHGFTIIAADIKAKKICYDHDFEGKCGILVGSEAHGLPDEVLQLCSAIVRIPMVGDTESFNVGVAGSILMYEAYRQSRGR